MPETLRAAIFLDRDGVINENRAQYVRTWEQLQLLAGALPALVVAFARVAGGVHWPSDALGGLALGTVAAVLAQFGFNWFDQRARAAASSVIVSGS